MRGEVDFCFVGGSFWVDDACFEPDEDCFEEDDACFEEPVVATEMAESCGEGGGYILAMRRRSTSPAQQDDTIEVRRDSSRGHVGSDSRFCSSCGLWLRLRASSDVSCFLSSRIGSVSRRPWRGRNAGSRRDSSLRRQGARCSAFNIEHGPAVWNGCCGGRDAQRQQIGRAHF